MRVLHQPLADLSLGCLEVGIFNVRASDVIPSIDNQAKGWRPWLDELLSVARSLLFCPRTLLLTLIFQCSIPSLWVHIHCFAPKCRFIFFLFSNCPQNYILPPGFWWFSSMELVTLRSSMPLILIEFINAFPTNFLFLQPKSFLLIFFSLFFLPLFLPKPPFRVFNLAGLP